MQKTFTTGLILGAMAIVLFGAVYISINTARTVSQDHIVLGQIVNLINSQQKSAAPATK